MALTEEQILQQINVLTTKTSENTSMAYKTNGTLNKGLNPDYFSGNNSKIVNAINLLAEKNAANDSTAKAVAAKVNEVLLDTTSNDGAVIWAETKELMGQATIIEGINSILKGEKAAQILGVTASDINKVLSVGVNNDGDLVIKAVDQIVSGGTVGEVTAESVAYSNEDVSSVTNVQEALDYVIEMVRNNDGSGEKIVSWDDVVGKPEVIVDSMILSEDCLELRDGDTVVSSIPLMTDEDVDDLIEQLN